MVRRLSELRRTADYLAHSAVMEFIDEISDLMQKDGVTQQQIAERTGWKPPYVSRILRGDANLTLKTMARLAAAFDRFIHIHLAPAGVLVQWSERSPDDLASARTARARRLKPAAGRGRGSARGTPA